MLELPVNGMEFYNERTGEFINVKGTVLKLEHSLISLSKWESKWHKPFFSKETRTYDEMVDYIRCMTIMQNVDPMIYSALTQKDIEKVENYMADPMTATTINRHGSKQKYQNVTSELIYSWMVSLGIPFECEKWQLNRLFTLIEVCGAEQSPKKKMRKNDILRQNAQLNAARKKARGTSG